MSYMLNEIHEQPDVIRKMAAAEGKNIASIAQKIKQQDTKFAMMAARGTSDNAATYGKYLFGIVNGLPVAQSAPSVYTLYNESINMKGSVVVGISQSGQAADAIECLQRGKESGAITVGITNEANSEFTKVADHTILCHAGPERSVAATKTYTASLVGLLMLSASLADRSDLIDGLLKSADGISQLFENCEERITQSVERYRYMDKCFVLARGINHATAFEAALKLAETCYVHVQAFSAADFLHGPIAMIEDGTPCFLYAPDGPAVGPMLHMDGRLREKGAENVVISDNQDMLKHAKTPFEAPAGINELLSPIVLIVFGQLFAHYLALSKGLDPDKPRGLSKVTITR